MRVFLNGKETEIFDGTSLQKLLEDMKIRPQMVACELNSKIVKRNQYGATIMSNGDHLEILQMIGGG